MIEAPAAQTTLVVPTELEREDAFADIAVLFGAGLVTWWLSLHGLAALGIPIVLGAVVWTLTGEPVTDVPYLGALAASFRSRLGLRRAHEWVQAWWHHFGVATWPTTWIARHLPRRKTAPAPATVRIAVLRVAPTVNYGMASPRERADEAESLARVLMGLSHRVQVIGEAHELSDVRDWPQPPVLQRRWLVVVRATDDVELAWRVRTVTRALEGVGLRCEPGVLPIDTRPVTIYPDCLRVGDAWCATLVLRRWPREVSPGWLGQALASDLPVHVGIHVMPQDPQRIARFLKKQQSWQTDYGLRHDAGNELGRRDAEVTRQRLIARTDRPVKVAVVLTVWAPTRDVLRQRVQTLGHEIGLVLGDVRLAKYEQDVGLEATSATGRCRLLSVWHTLDCASVASTWIMQPGTVDHAGGAELGTTREGGMLVKLDPFDPSLESFGGVVVAKVGMGKSFLLKLLARRLRGVQLLIVEQRTPAEYGDIPGARTLNLADVKPAERARVLRAWIDEVWAEAKADPRPRMLILDELWSLLRDPEVAELVEEIARIGRHHWLSLWIATQQVRELLKSGQAVLDNAAIRIYLRQHDRDLDDLAEAVGLPVPSRRFLRGAGRGQALLDCGGMLVPLDIQATPDEHREITTDPREKEALRRGSEHPGSLGSDRRNGHAADPVPTPA